MEVVRPEKEKAEKVDSKHVFSCRGLSKGSRLEILWDVLDEHGETRPVWWGATLETLEPSDAVILGGPEALRQESQESVQERQESQDAAEQNLEQSAEAHASASEGDKPPPKRARLASRQESQQERDDEGKRETTTRDGATEDDEEDKAIEVNTYAIVYDPDVLPDYPDPTPSTLAFLTTRICRDVAFGVDTVWRLEGEEWDGEDAEAMGERDVLGAVTIDRSAEAVVDQLLSTIMAGAVGKNFQQLDAANQARVAEAIGELREELTRAITAQAEITNVFDIEALGRVQEELAPRLASIRARLRGQV